MPTKRKTPPREGPGLQEGMQQFFRELRDIGMRPIGSPEPTARRLGDSQIYIEPTAGLSHPWAKPPLILTVLRQLKQDPFYRNLIYALAHQDFRQPTQFTRLLSAQEGMGPPAPGGPLHLDTHYGGASNVLGETTSTTAPTPQRVELNISYSPGGPKNIGYKQTLAHELMHVLNNYRNVVPYGSQQSEALADYIGYPNIAQGSYRAQAMGGGYRTAPDSPDYDPAVPRGTAPHDLTQGQRQIIREKILELLPDILPRWLQPPQR